MPLVRAANERACQIWRSHPKGPKLQGWHPETRRFEQVCAPRDKGQTRDRRGWLGRGARSVMHVRERTRTRPAGEPGVRTMTRRPGARTAGRASDVALSTELGPARTVAEQSVVCGAAHGAGAECKWRTAVDARAFAVDRQANGDSACRIAGHIRRTRCREWTRLIGARDPGPSGKVCNRPWVMVECGRMGSGDRALCAKIQDQRRGLWQLRHHRYDVAATSVRRGRGGGTTAYYGYAAKASLSSGRRCGGPNVSRTLHAMGRRPSRAVLDERVVMRSTVASQAATKSVKRTPNPAVRLRRSRVSWRARCRSGLVRLHSALPCVRALRHDDIAPAERHPSTPMANASRRITRTACVRQPTRRAETSIGLGPRHPATSPGARGSSPPLGHRRGRPPKTACELPDAGRYN